MTKVRITLRGDNDDDTDDGGGSDDVDGNEDGDKKNIQIVLRTGIQRETWWLALQHSLYTPRISSGQFLALRKLR